MFSSADLDGMSKAIGFFFLVVLAAVAIIGFVVGKLL